MLEIISHNLEDTNKIGKIIGENINKGTIICLDGDLGAGKTTLTQSIAKGLNIDDYITSPTFNIIKEYEGRLNLYHMDVYRIEDISEMYDLGYEEFFYSEGVCVIEWSHKIKEILPNERIDIHILKGKADNDRIFKIRGSGKDFEEILEELKKWKY